MGKNFIKVLVSGFGIGIVLTKIYDWGRVDGKRELIGQAVAFVEETVKEAEKTE